MYVVLAAECPFGALLAGDLILQRAQLLLPLVFSLVNFLDAYGTYLLPGVTESDDSHRVFVVR